MDASLEAELITKATDLSYEKSGKRSAANLRISKQTVMNSIRNLGALDYDALIPTTNVKDQKKVKIIYIEADEDHVAMQDGSNKQVRLIYVHEGRKRISSGRYQLINPYYFTKGDGSSEEFWLEVADYLDQVYDLDYTQTIYLSGDGARWIKEGLSWIKGSRYVLDYFHLSKYVRKATAHLIDMDHELWCSIHELDQAGVKEVFVDILKNTEQETKIKSIKECRHYILNNWEHIQCS